MIDVAFAIALLLSLLKLAEMALRPHQKKALQAALEHATLTLDVAYPDYSTWIAKLPALNAAYVFLFGAIGFFASALVVTTSQSKTTVLIALISVYLVGLIVTASGVWRHARLILETWGWGPRSIRGGGLPTAVAGFGAALAVFLAIRYLGAVLLLLFLRKKYRSYHFPLSAFPGIVLTGALAYPTFWVLKPLVRLVLAIMWRVIEYQGGAWLALLFLATAALGVFKAIAG